MQDTNQHSQPELESVVDPQVSTILRCLAPEEIDMLRDAFIYMDKDSDGFVNLHEMLAKVRACVPPERFAPLREYLTPLFVVADKDGDGKLSLTEFLMSFADGPGVVPADVVNSCVAAVRVRLTDEEISTLQENFRAMDLNEDGYLDAAELEGALRRHLERKFPELTDSQYKEIVTVIMSSADADGDGKLCLSEFIRSFQEDQGVLPASFIDPNFTGYDAVDAGSGSGPGTRELTEAETNVLREAFAVLDTNDDGYVDFVDLYNALWESLSSQVEDKTQIKDLCYLIMATADRRNSGRLSLPEFILGFLRNMEVMQIPVAVAQEKVRSACNRLQQMYESGELERLVTVFEDLDSNGDGYIDHAEMVSVLMSLFKDAFPEWDEETLNSVMTAIVAGAAPHSTGRISLEEFVRSFVDGPGILPPEAVRVLDSRATASRSHLRPSTASDDDLRRISDALRSLNETADSEGYITEDSLRCGIDKAFADQAETHPGKAEAMFRYVLSRFVNVLDGGRLEWNENVQIEEEVEEDGREASGGTNAEVAVAACSPIPVPAAQDQEAVPDEITVVEDEVAAEPREGTEAKAAPAPPATGNEDAERPHSSSAGRRRRVVRAASIEMEPVTASVNAEDSVVPVEHETEGAEGEAIGATGQVAADAVVPEGSAAGDVCDDFDIARAAAEENGEEEEEGEERLAPSTLCNAAARPSNSVRGASTRQSAVLTSYKYGVGVTGDHDPESIFEEELRMLFKKYDTAKLGCLDRNQFKKVYYSMEQYGLEPSQADADRQFTKYARGSDKIFFDEFCVLMLQRVQM